VFCWLLAASRIVPRRASNSPQLDGRPVLFMPTHCALAAGLKSLHCLTSASCAVPSSFRQACVPVPGATDPRAAALQLWRTSSFGGPPAEAIPQVARAIAAPMTLTLKARMNVPVLRQRLNAAPHRQFHAAATQDAWRAGVSRAAVKNGGGTPALRGASTAYSGQGDQRGHGTGWGDPDRASNPSRHDNTRYGLSVCPVRITTSAAACRPLS